jgi:hypothetical protein
MKQVSDLPYRIEEVDADRNPIELLAAASNNLVARAAFAAALDFRPKSRVILRQRALVMEDRDRHIATNCGVFERLREAGRGPKIQHGRFHFATRQQGR